MQNKYCTRSDRLAELIHKELAGIIVKYCQDPRLENLTITNVKLTPDLSIAKIYFTSFIDQNAAKIQASAATQIGMSNSIKQILKILTNASSFLRCRLAEKMSLRKVPELRFFYDENLDYGLKMELLLSKIVER